MLVHGVYDTVSTITKNSNYLEAKNKFCSAYSKYSFSASSGGGGFSIGDFGLNANFDDSSTQSIAESMCKEGLSAALSDAQVNKLTKVLDRNAIDAWSACVALNSEGMKMQPSFGNFDGSVAISMIYKSPAGGNETRRIDKIVVNGFTCTGELWDRRDRGVDIGNGFKHMNCARTVEKSPFMYNGDSVYAKPASITLFTNSRPAYKLDFAPIYNSAAYPTQWEKQISDLRQSLDDLKAQNQLLNGKLDQEKNALRYIIVNYPQNGVENKCPKGWTLVGRITQVAT